MSEKTAATITVPGVDFAEMARAVVAAKIAEGLCGVGSQDAVRHLVLGALTTQVSVENGNTSPRSYEKQCSWVEYVVADMIRTETKKALAAQVEELRPVIHKAVAAELRKKSNSIAQALVTAYENEAKSGYRIGVSMEFQRHER